MSNSAKQTRELERSKLATAGTVALWVVQIALAAFFVMAAIPKLTGAPEMIGLFEAVGVGQWFRYVTGGLELGAAVVLAIPGLAGIGAVILASVMGGAVLTHLFIIGGSAAMPAVLLVVAALVAYVRRAEVVRVAGNTRSVTSASAKAAGLALILALAIVGPYDAAHAQDGQDNRAKKAETVERATRELVATYVHAWNNHDMDTWERLFTADSDFVNRGGGWWRPLEVNVREHAVIHEMLSGRGVVMDLEAELAALDVLAPGVALAHVTTVWPGANVASAADGPPAAIMTWVVVERDGRWLVRAVQNTLVDGGPRPQPDS